MEFDNENHSQQQNILIGTSFAASSFGTIFASRDVHLTCHSICTLDFNGGDSHLILERLFITQLVGYE
jgi:hypothetical protein